MAKKETYNNEKELERGNFFGGGNRSDSKGAKRKGLSLADKIAKYKDGNYDEE
jgi:hypothetical protein